MAGILFLGDEVTAAGFRLAGVDIDCPEPAELEPILTREMKQRSVIFLTTQIADYLPADLAERLRLSTDPVCVFLPDIRGAQGALDLVSMVRRELGIEVSDG